jgi:hypothetical protein
MHSLDDRLRALAEGLEDARPASTDMIGRRATQLRRRRRLAATSGAVAAGLIVVVGAYAAFGWADRASDVTTIDQAPTTEPAPTTASTLPRDTTSTTATEPDTTRPPPAVSPAAPGSLESATPAIRAACRRFYGSGLGESELASTCDQPEIEFRSDCYANRPATFVPDEGGCAYLGGYLAVWHGEHPEIGDGTVDYRFPVDDDVWWIQPESD